VATRNTIIAGNSAPTSPDVSGALNSQGYNLIGDGTGGSGFDPTDQVGTSANPIDPMLGPLQGNGGPTQTRALLPGSPALDVGDPALSGTADQRGVVRSGGVNIGAYQASATAFVVVAPNMVTAGVPFDLTVTAVDPFGQVAVGYSGTITFSTSDPDPGVVLPADYTFQPGDAGQVTFPGGVVLMTPATQTVTATDTVDNTIAGTVAVTVSSPSSPSRPGCLAGNPALQPNPGVVAAVDRLFAALPLSRLRHEGQGEIRPWAPGPFGVQNLPWA
jgi:hypothetical protein